MVAWNIPYSDQVLATLAGINTFLGALVKYYKAKYDAQKGEGDNAI
jgi:hypothetical protein